MCNRMEDIMTTITRIQSERGKAQRRPVDFED